MVLRDFEFSFNGEEEKCEEGFAIPVLDDFRCLLAFKVLQLCTAEIGVNLHGEQRV